MRITEKSTDREIMSFIEGKRERLDRDATADGDAVPQGDGAAAYVKVSMVGIGASYEAVRRQVWAGLGGGDQAGREAALEGAAAEDVALLDRADAGFAEEERSCNDQARRMPPLAYNWRNYWWHMGIEVLIFMMDIPFYGYSLIAFGGPTLACLLIGAAVAVSLGITSGYIAWKYRKLEEEDARRFAKRWAVRMACVFAVFGALRSYALMGFALNLTAKAVIAFLAFFVASGVIFFGATLLACLLPTAEDYRARWQHRLMEQRLNKIRKKRKSLSDERDAIIRKLREGRGYLTSLSSRREYFENVIRECRTQTLLAFRRAAISRNPDSFDDDQFLNSNPEP